MVGDCVAVGLCKTPRNYQKLSVRQVCAAQYLNIHKTTVYMEGSKIFTFIYMQNLKITRW
jgi:hypothetical protein